MTNLQHFQFTDNDIRVVTIKGEPWFVAKDVCQVLGISKYRDALTRLDKDERGSVKLDTPGGKQGMAMVSESGLYDKSSGA
jgi:prophage antirepressor-like protein